MTPLQRVILRDLQKQAVAPPPMPSSMIPEHVRAMMRNNPATQPTATASSLGTQPAVKPPVEAVQSAIQSTPISARSHIQADPNISAQPAAIPTAKNVRLAPGFSGAATANGVLQTAHANAATHLGNAASGLPLILGGIPTTLQGLSQKDETGRWNPLNSQTAIGAGVTGLGAALSAGGARQLAQGGLRGITPRSALQATTNAVRAAGPRGLLRGAVRGAGNASLGYSGVEALQSLLNRDEQGNRDPQWGDAATSLAVGAVPYAASRMATKAPTRLAAPSAKGLFRRGGQALGRLAPFMNAGFALNDAGEQFSKGNYLGAALNGGAALTSEVPPLSLLLQSAGGLTDIYGDWKQRYDEAGRLQANNQQMLRDTATGKNTPYANPQYLTPGGLQG